jgi:hypothetical protein
MIQLPKYFNPETNTFEPDFSGINLENWQVKGYAMNEDNESYTVDLKWISAVPFSITPAQGRMMLLQMGLLSTVKASIEYSNNESLLIFWEYALSWDRDNIHIAAMAGMLEMTEQQTDQFFIEAKKI